VVLAYENMRRVQAIVLVFALLAAPLALFAGVYADACAAPVCTMACCHHGKCLMQKHQPCEGSTPSIQCDCMAMPGFWLLAPLPQTILPRLASSPLVRETRAALPVSPAPLSSGFQPELFLPPRG
jgi:hypothetical protein